MFEHGNYLSVHYDDRRYNNDKVIDSSRKRDKAFTFHVRVGEVMSGWDKGLQNMRAGKKRNLIIPNDSENGKFSASYDVPGDTAIIYDVELIKILEDDEAKQKERWIDIEDKYPKY